MDLYIFKVMLYVLLTISFITLGFVIYLLAEEMSDLFKERKRK